MNATTIAPSYIDRLMTAAFFPGRTVRSEPYKQGVRSILMHRLIGGPLATTPYVVGTCEADAYFSGQDEGHAIARKEIGGEL